MEAEKSPMKCKHGAIIVHRNKIIARGYNRYLHHNNVSKNIRQTLHAEKAAIMNCRNVSLLPKSVLIVVRIHPDGLKESKPCTKCQKEIMKRRIMTTYYTTDEGDKLVRL